MEDPHPCSLLLDQDLGKWEDPSPMDHHPLADHLLQVDHPLHLIEHNLLLQDPLLW